MVQEVKQNIEEDKTTAIIAYITLVGLIIAFVINKDKKSVFASYHIRQSLGIICTALVLSFINVIPILGWIISVLGFLLLIVIWVTGLMNAINGNQKPVMVLGEFFNRWFKEI